jgi:hypothetical protein
MLMNWVKDKRNWGIVIKKIEHYTIGNCFFNPHPLFVSISTDAYFFFVIPAFPEKESPKRKKSSIRFNILTLILRYLEI